MDPGELLFETLTKLGRRIERLRSPPESEHTARFEAEAPILRALFAMIAKEGADLRISDDRVGYASGMLLLPATIDLLASDAENAALYRAMLLYAAAFRTNGWHEPTWCETAHARQFVTAFHAFAADRWLATELPGAEALIRPLARSLAERLRVDGGDRLGVFCRELLEGRSPSETSLCRSHGSCEVEVNPSASELRDMYFALFSERDRSRSPAAVILWGALPPATAPVAGLRSGRGDHPAHNGQNSLQTAKSVVLKRVTRFLKQDNPVFHSFEKKETLEDYRGERSSFHDTGDLEEQEEAIRDLSLGQTVRTNEAGSGTLQLNVIADGVQFTLDAEEETNERVALYPEWNAGRGMYRERWCTVFEREAAGSTAPAAAGSMSAARIAAVRTREIRSIRRTVLRTLTVWERRARQLDGPDFDLDAMVERHADLAAGRTPGSRLYLREHRATNDVAIVLLFDTSLSTEGWIDARQVIAVEKETMVIIARAFAGLIDSSVMVATFFSNSRADCRFTVVKPFDGPWTLVERGLDAIEPAGYTRIGPAVRHAVSLLTERRSRRRVLILVSDGKPTDFDYYEGAYGIEDVRQSLREAQAARVQPFCVAIQREGGDAAARLFGKGRYRAVPHPGALPAAIAELCTRCLR